VWMAWTACVPHARRCSCWGLLYRRHVGCVWSAGGGVRASVQKRQPTRRVGGNAGGSLVDVGAMVRGAEVLSGNLGRWQLLLRNAKGLASGPPRSPLPIMLAPS
jgi:hypothetical protein